MRNSLRKFGIVLITTLIAIVVVVMLLLAAIKLIPGSSSAAGSLGDREIGLAAAQAGVEYAQTRLQQNPSWKGGLNSASPVDVVQTSTIQVREDRGNVIGLLTLPTGEHAEFLIRFSPQDGSGVGNPGYIIKNPYISVNNLFGSGAVPAYLGNGSGWAVTTSSNFVVPASRCDLIVEGKSGAGMRDATLNAPDPSGFAKVTSRVVEVSYAPNNGGSLPNLMYSYGPMAVGANNAKIVMNVAKGVAGAPKLYSGDNLDLQNTKEVNSKSNAELHYVNGLLNAALTATKGATTVHDVSPPALPTLRWSDIKTATAADPQLKAGTYVWQNNGGAMQLFYYDSEYDPIAGTSLLNPATKSVVPTDFTGFASNVPSGPIKPIIWDNTGAKTPNGDDHLQKNQVVISANVKVTPTAASNSIAFVTDSSFAGSAAFAQHYDKDFALQFSPAANGTAILTTDNPLANSSNVYVEGQLGGQGGSITAGGNILQAGQGVNLYLNPNAGAAVNLYAKGDIRLAPTDIKNDGSSENGDLGLSGIIYTWQNFVGNVASNKKFKMTGSLVAYSGDPSGGGHMGIANGTVNVTAGEVDLIYDSSYLTGFSAAAGSSPLNLTRSMWVNY